MSMKAVKWSAAKGKMELMDVPIPTNPRAGHVILKTAYAGICGTDIAIRNRKFPFTSDGVTLGHEFVGVVTSVGDGVSCVKVGDEVAPNPMTSCETCRSCVHLKPDLCTNFAARSYLGVFGGDGGFAAYCEVAASKCVIVPDGLSLMHAVLSEPMACITTSYQKVKDLPVDSKVLVMGAGIAGIIWSCLLHFHGYRDITVTNRSTKRIQIVRDLGLGFKVSHPDDVAKTCVDASKIEETGFDLIVDATGNQEVVEKALSWLRGGGTMNLYGFYAPGANIKLDPSAVMARGVSVVGSAAIRYTFADTVQYLARMGETYFNYDKIGVKLYKLEQYNEALDALERKEITKAVFEFEK